MAEPMFFQVSDSVPRDFSNFPHSCLTVMKDGVCVNNWINDEVQDPRQLRQMLSHLEENNLFLIQTAQEAEEAAEAATTKLRAQMTALDAESASLRQQIDSLRATQAKQQGRCQALKVCPHHQEL